MSSIPQNYSDEKALVDCIQRFFQNTILANFLPNVMHKEKGVSSVSLLKYKLGNIFVGRSMYLQQRTGSFKEGFSKNTFLEIFELCENKLAAFYFPSCSGCRQ